MGKSGFRVQGSGFRSQRWISSCRNWELDGTGARLTVGHLADCGLRKAGFWGREWKVINMIMVARPLNDHLSYADVGGKRVRKTAFLRV